MSAKDLEISKIKYELQEAEGRESEAVSALEFKAAELIYARAELEEKRNSCEELEQEIQGMMSSKQAEIDELALSEKALREKLSDASQG